MSPWVAVDADNLLVVSDADGMLLSIKGDTRPRNRAADEMNFVEGALWSDHYTAGEINAAVGRGDGFGGAFPGEGAGDLEALRELFRRKALLARQGRVCSMLLDADEADAATIVALSVADLPDDPEVARCLVLRRELGLPSGPDAPAIVAGDGSPIPASELTVWLRRARLVSLSLGSNGGLCRSLLRARHGIPDPTEEVAT